jgi:hypothetical protein
MKLVEGIVVEINASYRESTQTFLHMQDLLNKFSIGWTR